MEEETPLQIVPDCPGLCYIWLKGYNEGTRWNRHTAFVDSVRTDMLIYGRVRWPVPFSFVDPNK